MCQYLYFGICPILGTHKSSPILMSMERIYLSRSIGKNGFCASLLVDIPLAVHCSNVKRIVHPKMNILF